MTTSAEIAQQVMNELDRGSFWWRPDRRPTVVRAKVRGVEYVVDRHGNELRFYRPGESHRWLSIHIDVHADGRVTVSPDLGALHFSSLDSDEGTQGEVAQVGERVGQVLTKLGYGDGRTRTRTATKAPRRGSSTKKPSAQLQREIDAVLDSTARRTRRS